MSVKTTETASCVAKKQTCPRFFENCLQTTSKKVTLLLSLLKTYFFLKKICRYILFSESGTSSCDKFIKKIENLLYRLVDLRKITLSLIKRYRKDGGYDKYKRNKMVNYRFISFLTSISILNDKYIIYCKERNSVH